MDLNRSETLSAHPISARVSFGASGLGNLYRVISDDVADATLAEAFAKGIRHFDTSPFYGFGLSELRVGRFLRNLDRDAFLLSSKVGRYMTPPRGKPVDKLHWAGPLELKPVFDYSYDGVMHSIEQSAIRLGFESIDILFIHDVDRWTQGAQFAHAFAAAMEGAYRALAELRQAGHVKAIGVGINEPDVAADFVRAGDFDCVMLAGRYTLRTRQPWTSFCRSRWRAASKSLRPASSIRAFSLRCRPIGNRCTTTPKPRPTSSSAQPASPASAPATVSRRRRRQSSFRAVIPP